MSWFSKMNKTEMALFILTLIIFFITTVARIINQNDFNLFWFYTIVYLITFIITTTGSIIIHYIPYIPRTISAIIGSIFIIMILGLHILPAIALTYFAVGIVYYWKCITSESFKRHDKFNIIKSLVLISTLSLFVFVSVYLFKNGFYNNLPNIGDRNTTIDSLVNLSDDDDKKYEVQKFTYGSGKDKYRSEFSSEANIITNSIDGSAFINNWDGFSGWYRTKYWGFDATKLPLNGYVWMPKGHGAFPIVLIVHGDHAMQDYSEKGYEYIAELLAKKGYIVVSVDQNYLNRSWSDLLLTSPLTGDHKTRGWLLLEHLKLWRQWNKDNTTFLYNKVDMNHISLIGHSRGGEAVAIAAAFNNLNNFPDTPSIKFDYKFGIKSVISIAPTDGNYQPLGKKFIELNNVNYLLLQGSHDGEMGYVGIGQYSRTFLQKDTDKLKTSIYIFGANHSQFNTSWGSNDHEFFHPFSTKWDYHLLLSDKKQREIAKNSMLAFLELTIKGKERYRPLLNNPMSYNSGVICLSQHQKASDNIIFEFENGNTDFITTNHVTFKNERLAHGANTLKLEWQKQLDHSKDKNWVSFEIPSASIIESQKLRFDLSNGTDLPIDFIIQIFDKNGEKISFPLSRAGKTLPSRFKRALKKADNLSSNITSEIAFETFSFDLSNIKKEVPINSIKFIFDKNKSGIIYIDNLGFEYTKRP